MRSDSILSPRPLTDPQPWRDPAFFTLSRALEIRCARDARPLARRIETAGSGGSSVAQTSVRRAAMPAAQLFDLGRAARRPHAVGFREAALWSVFYVGVALLFGVVFALLAGWDLGAQ